MNGTEMNGSIDDLITEMKRNSEEISEGLYEVIRTLDGLGGGANDVQVQP